MDNTPPQATLDAPASICPSCGTASLTYAVHDVSSGLVSWDLSVDETSLASGTTSVMDTFIWDGSGLSLGAHTLTLAVTDLAGNTTDVTVSINLEAAPPVEPSAEKPSFLWFLATKTPTPTPTATQAVSTPTATCTPVVETFGVVPPVVITSPDPLLPDPELPGSSILWGAAAAGVIAAATAYSLEEKRKREEEEARQRAEAEQQNADARAREKGYDSYADMLEAQAKAAFDAQWNAMLADQQAMQDAQALAQNVLSNPMLADFIRNGDNPPPGYEDMSDAERLALYQQTQQYQTYQASLVSWESEKKQYQAWLHTGKNPPIEYADVTEAERLAMYQQTQEYQAYQALAATALAVEQDPLEERQTLPLSQRIAEGLENVLYWGITNSLGYKALAYASSRNENLERELTTVIIPQIADLYSSTADPDRNPRSAQFVSQIWNGIDAWGEIGRISYDTVKYTTDAISEGRWSDAGRGALAIAQENATIHAYGLKAIRIALWGIVSTPIRIPHDIEEFADAGSERLNGKDRFWDVLWTSSNLNADLAGTYMMAKPFGLIDRANAGLSKLFLGEAMSDQFVTAYLKDALFNGGQNRQLFTNLIESKRMMPSPEMTNFLRFQNLFQRMINISEEIQASLSGTKPSQTTGDLDAIYRMADEANSELQSLITDFAEKTGGQAQFPESLKSIERALEKINGDYGGDASRLTDVTRGRIVYKTLEDLYSGIEDIIAPGLRERGMLAFFKDRFLKPQPSGYRDIIVNVELSNGHIGELRLELAQFNEIATIEHGIYEQIRTIEANASMAGRLLTPSEEALVVELRAQAQHLYDEAWTEVITNFIK